MTDELWGRRSALAAATPLHLMRLRYVLRFANRGAPELGLAAQIRSCTNSVNDGCRFSNHMPEEVELEDVDVEELELAPLEELLLVEEPLLELVVELVEEDEPTEASPPASSAAAASPPPPSPPPSPLPPAPPSAQSLAPDDDEVEVVDPDWVGTSPEEEPLEEPDWTTASSQVFLLEQPQTSATSVANRHHFIESLYENRGLVGNALGNYGGLGCAKQGI